MSRLSCAATSSSSTITPGAADSEPLRQAFESHLEQTRGQIERLDQVFEQLDLPKRAKKCEAMEGLIEEARSHMDEIDDGALLDVGMIICAQKIEHYEIAGLWQPGRPGGPTRPRRRRLLARADRRSRPTRSSPNSR